MEEIKKEKRTQKKVVFSERLRFVMDLKGYSSTRLAKEAGVSISIVCRYVAGKSNPTVEVASKISNVLNCNIGFLTGETRVLKWKY